MLKAHSISSLLLNLKTYKMFKDVQKPCLCFNQSSKQTLNVVVSSNYICITLSHTDRNTVLQLVCLISFTGYREKQRDNVVIERVCKGAVYTLTALLIKAQKSMHVSAVAAGFMLPKCNKSPPCNITFGSTDKAKALKMFKKGTETFFFNAQRTKQLSTTVTKVARSCFTITPIRSAFTVKQETRYVMFL